MEMTQNPLASTGLLLSLQKLDVYVTVPPRKYRLNQLSLIWNSIWGGFNHLNNISYQQLNTKNKIHPKLDSIGPTGI